MTNPIGIAVAPSEDLAGELSFLQSLGYDAIEISPDAYNLLFCGRLHKPILDRVLPVMRRFPFRYTVHSPAMLDLRDVGDFELQMQMARSVVEFCGLINAEVLVVHFEQQSPDPAVEQVFLNAVRELADLAAGTPLRIGVENIEVETVAPVLEFIRRVDRPNVGLTYDVGHAYLAARHFGFDYLDSVRAAKPLLIQLHVTDNFGRFNLLRLQNFTLYRTQVPRDILPTGRGDLHLPVGWGSIPYAETLAELRGFKGMVVTEYKYPLFRSEAPRLTEELREMVRQLSV